MIIFGWGKVTLKNFGGIQKKQCGHCHNEGIWELRRYRTWFTLFFIPVIPYSQKALLVCPICEHYIMLTSEQFKELRLQLENPGQNAAPTVDQYDGLNDVQRNFRQAMNEQEK